MLKLDLSLSWSSFAGAPADCPDQFGEKTNMWMDVLAVGVQSGDKMFQAAVIGSAWPACPLVTLPEDGKP